MDRDNVSPEAIKALNDFKLEIAGDISVTGLEASEEKVVNGIGASEEIALNELGIGKETNIQNKHLYDLRFNLTPSDSVTKQGLRTREKSNKNPNYPFKDFLGKGF